MMAGLMLLIAYILPLPIMLTCLYFKVFSFIDGTMMRLIAVGITSLLPSAIIMLYAVKKTLHLVFNVVCVAGILFVLNHFGLISLTAG